jgi:translin
MPELDEVSRRAQQALRLKHEAREAALPKSRAAIRCCANSIRAVHRGEFSRAADLRREAASLLREIRAGLLAQSDIFYAGFVQDAQKEYAEAAITAALIQRQALPIPEDLDIDWAPYLNGMGEAIGELRRAILDRMRQGQLDGCEDLLRNMDEMYALLTTIDFPDAITGGLRRTTDAARGILEKTRGDFTVAMSQARLGAAISAVNRRLESMRMERNER